MKDTTLYAWGLGVWERLRGRERHRCKPRAWSNAYNEGATVAEQVFRL